MIGRPREFSNAAEKQKAYRDRKKQDESRMHEALTILEEVEAEKVTLLKSIQYWISKGNRVEIELANQDRLTKLLAGGYVQGGPSVYVVKHLIRQGALVYVRKDWAGSYYRLETGQE